MDGNIMHEKTARKRNGISSSRQGADPIDVMIKAKAILAPMAGVTDIPFRIMARKFGCAFAFTEMIDVNGIVHRNLKSFQLMESVPGDSPLGVQLVGQDGVKLFDVARMCEDKGFDVLDLNAGCPVRKVVKGGKGAALLKEPAKLAGIVRGLVKSVSIPVTVKIRSGWDEENLNYLETAKIVADEGAKAVCIHPRTRQQMLKGTVNHDLIREVKEKINIPVFASGNIFNASDAKDVFQKTGCDAVFVARGALGKPWIFEEINAGLNDRPFRGIPDFQELKEIVYEHYILCVDYYGEKRTKHRMYKYITWYLKRFKNLDAVMKEYRKVESSVTFRRFLDGMRVDEGKRLRIAGR